MYKSDREHYLEGVIEKLKSKNEQLEAESLSMQIGYMILREREAELNEKISALEKENLEVKKRLNNGNAIIAALSGKEKDIYQYKDWTIIPNKMFNNLIKDFINNHLMPEIKDVKFSEPYTTVFWGDGTRTVVKCSEPFDKEKGLAMAISKRLLSENEDCFYNEIKKWCGYKERSENK